MVYDTYIYIYIYLFYFLLDHKYIWVNYNDLTVIPNPGIIVNKGNDPHMAARFRLVKY